MYTVVGKARSRAFRVMWALAEMGIDYTHVDVGPKSDGAREYHPSGKIPVMMVGDEALTDSVAIMTYLTDVHGKLGYPAGTVQRARLDAMLHYINEDIDAPLWLIAKHSVLLPEDRRAQGAIDTARWELERTFDALETRIKGPWLMGEDFTIADILAVHCIGWAFGGGIPLENQVVKEYGKRARARAAFRSAGQQ